MSTNDVFHASLFDKDAPVGMYRLSPEGKILNVNEALATMLGYESPKGLVGESFEQKVISSPSARSNFKQLLHWNGQVEDFISPWRKRDGSRLLVREAGWIIPDERGGILFYEGSATPAEDGL